MRRSRCCCLTCSAARPLGCGSDAGADGSPPPRASGRCPGACMRDAHRGGVRRAPPPLDVVGAICSNVGRAVLVPSREARDGARRRRLRRRDAGARVGGGGRIEGLDACIPAPRFPRRLRGRGRGPRSVAPTHPARERGRGPPAGTPTSACAGFTRARSATATTRCSARSCARFARRGVGVDPSRGRRLGTAQARRRLQE